MLHLVQVLVFYETLDFLCLVDLIGSAFKLCCPHQHGQPQGLENIWSLKLRFSALSRREQN